MSSFRKFSTLIVAALVGVAMLGAPASARASFSLYLQEDGGGFVLKDTQADFTGVSFNGTFGDFKIQFLGGSSDNTGTPSDLLTGVTSIKNLSGNTHTLSIWVNQTNYTLPTGTPLIVESGMAATINSGTLKLTDIFQAYADTNNGTPLTTGTSDFTNGPQDATKTGSTADTGSATGLFNRTNTNYSLTSVSNFELSGGGQINSSSHVNVSAVPAPAGVVLALSSLPFLGIGTWLRRRKANLQTS